MTKLLFTFLPFVFGLLAFLLFVLPAKLKVRAQAIWAMVLLFCAARFLCYRCLGGNAFAPELPEKLIWFWNIASDGLTILTLLALPGLLIPRRLRLFVLPLLAWGIAARGLWNGVKVPEVREMTIAFPNLPASLEGYRILQISDIHSSAAARRWRTEAIVERANATKADLICLTGDYSDGDTRYQRRNVEPLRRLKARDGVCSVSGNHEYYYDWTAYRAMYAAWGIPYLENTCVFPHPGLAVGGVNDPAGMQHGARPPDIAKAFAAATNGEFRILLQHRPSFAPSVKANPAPFDLQLSGHTHGGVAPIVRDYVAKKNGGFVLGLYWLVDNVRALFVSPGAGQWAGFPMRFFNDPEMTLFTLRRH